MHRVKCYYCGQYFDRDKEPAVKLENMNRYAHENATLITQIQLDKSKLNQKNILKSSLRWIMYIQASKSK